MILIGYVFFTRAGFHPRFEPEEVYDNINMRTEARVTEGPGKYIAFGPADSIFILNRAAEDACSDLQKAIEAK